MRRRAPRPARLGTAEGAQRDDRVTERRCRSRPSRSGRRGSQRSARRSAMIAAALRLASASPPRRARRAPDRRHPPRPGGRSPPAAPGPDRAAHPTPCASLPRQPPWLGRRRPTAANSASAARRAARSSVPPAASSAARAAPGRPRLGEIAAQRVEPAALDPQPDPGRPDRVVRQARAPGTPPPRPIDRARSRPWRRPQAAARHRSVRRRGPARAPSPPPRPRAPRPCARPDRAGSPGSSRRARSPRRRRGPRRSRDPRGTARCPSSTRPRSARSVPRIPSASAWSDASRPPGRRRGPPPRSAATRRSGRRHEDPGKVGEDPRPRRRWRSAGTSRSPPDGGRRRGPVARLPEVPALSLERLAARPGSRPASTCAMAAVRVRPPPGTPRRGRRSRPPARGCRPDRLDGRRPPPRRGPTARWSAGIGDARRGTRSPTRRRGRPRPSRAARVLVAGRIPVIGQLGRRRRGAEGRPAGGSIRRSRLERGGVAARASAHARPGGARRG